MNTLKNETSPYLLQHADNPVDWYPWGAEALDLARSQNKPILLSIGYSACHWCHVMAHESFEDEQTADLMNRLFINIKIDREERPDIDKIYQAAHQLMQRRPGGWPLTVFLDPGDHRPFFAGTYFPKEARYGMPAFTDLLNKANDHFHADRNAVSEYGQSVVAALQHIDTAQPADGDLLSGNSLPAVREALGQTFDNINGGFGDAPKFPHPTNLDRLMRHWRNSALDSQGNGPDKQAMFICALTLSRMAEGGIFDQIGGGFCRYSVDAQWTIPHFEKMLYDNGQLLALYAQFWQISGDDTYRRVALDTAGWVRCARCARPKAASTRPSMPIRKASRAGFTSGTRTKSARSCQMMNTPHSRPASDSINRPTSKAIGTCVSAKRSNHRIRIPDKTRPPCNASSTNHASSCSPPVIARIRPGRDDKILTSWNALMIRGLAIAARALYRTTRLPSAAAKALDFIRHNMIVDDRLYATCKEGQREIRRLSGRLCISAGRDDRTVTGTLGQRTPGMLATWLADRLLADFTDTEHGGFFFTAADHEQLIHRSKPMSDEALPSGNGIAALATQSSRSPAWRNEVPRSRSCDNQRDRRRARRFPHAHTSLITALDEITEPG